MQINDGWMRQTGQRTSSEMTMYWEDNIDERKKNIVFAATAMLKLFSKISKLQTNKITNNLGAINPDFYISSQTSLTRTQS